MKNVYYSLIYAHIIYAIEVWGSAFKTELDKILILQKRVMRLVTFNDEFPAIPGFSKLLLVFLNLDGSYRGTKSLDLKSVADKAIAECKAGDLEVTTCIVVQNLSNNVENGCVKDKDCDSPISKKAKEVVVYILNKMFVCGIKFTIFY